MTFDIEEMRKRFQKYGTIYTKEEIREDVDDIIGHDEKKELMDDFFLALKKFEEIAPNLKEVRLSRILPCFFMDRRVPEKLV